MEGAPLSGGQMACAMLFGAAIITYLGLEVSRFRVLVRDGVDPSMRHTASKHSEPLAWTFPSLYAFFRDTAALGLVLLVAFMCENYPLYPRGEKVWSSDMYWSLCLLLLVASLMTMRKGKSTDILNRDQTEEWKGWMQFMFLLYHYYKAEEVYNAIRIMITCYVWMTGFGNFSFFYIKQDFGVVRFVQMLWRLNFLVILLCLSQANTYILYYICPLHTFYFLLVFVTMRVFPRSNHGKWDIRLKLIAVALVIYTVWDLFSGSVFNSLFSPFLGTAPVIGAKSGTLWEWYFRTSLDHWSTLLGMVFALNFPMATHWLTKVEERPRAHQLRVKGLTGLFIAVPFLWWAITIFPKEKIEYNHTNAYYGFIPLLTYIYFRNITPSLRAWHSGLLHDIGKVTLETYLMQHHVWLTSNAKTLLVLLPGAPNCNLVLVSVLFVYLSRQTFYITMSLRGMVLPDDRRRCITGAIVSTILLSSLVGLGWFLSVIGLGFMTAAVLSAIAAIVLLALVHQRVNLNLWGHVRQGPSGSGGLTGLRAPASPDSFLSLGRVFFTLVLTGFLLSLPLRPPLPLTPSSSSSSSSRSSSSSSSSNTTPAGVHNLAVTPPPISPSAASCLTLLNQNEGWNEGKEEWSWPNDKEAVGCGFHLYDKSELQELYKGKEVVVVGDSLGREYYFSLLANMGSPAPDAHDSNAPKHQDLKSEGGSEGAKNVSFLWRPYVKDILEEVQRWRVGERKGGKEVVVMSFGLWDTLHKTSQEEYADTLKTLNQSLAAGEGEKEEGVEGKERFWAWLVPTRIVNEKLQTEEKKAKMTEEQVAKLREQTMESGLFQGGQVMLLDGRRVSEGQEGRSMDGVHYDDVVYGALVQQAANALRLWEGNAGKVGSVQGALGSNEAGGGQRRLYVQGVGGLDDVADWEPWVSRGEEIQPESSSRPQRLLQKKDETSRKNSESSRSTAAAATAPAGGGGKSVPVKIREIDGSMSSPVYGAIVLIVCMLMLLTFDSYAGAAVLGLFVARSDASVTWEEAYEPLLRKILRASTPSSSSSSSGSSSSSSGRSSSSTSGGGVAESELEDSIGVGTNSSTVGGGFVHQVVVHHTGGSAVRGRYTPVPQAEMELGGMGNQSSSSP